MKRGGQSEDFKRPIETADLLVVRTVADLRRAVAGFRKAGRTIGLVPTMGALHEGHVSLVKGALERGDVPVTSIFVNPTQFGPKEDFSAYPRDEEGDFTKLREAGGAGSPSPRPRTRCIPANSSRR